jgi:uncharacterized protein (DUF111 family)
VVVGTAADAVAPGVEVVQLEVNVDDATGEVLADTIAAALDAGAVDAWVTPIVMKKGRPAHTVSALVDPVLAAQVGRVLTEGTGSFGVRAHRPQRLVAPRDIAEVSVEGHPVRIKVGPGRAKPEYDDAARVARLTGLPLREVQSRAEEAWRHQDAGAGGAFGGRHVGDHDHGHDHPHDHDHDHPHPH